ncbi:unnamed protein product, partial [Choristocarpus tenellus]
AVEVSDVNDSPVINLPESILTAGGLLYVDEDTATVMGAFVVYDVDDSSVRVKLTAGMGRIDTVSGSRKMLSIVESQGGDSGSSAILEGTLEDVGTALSGLTYTGALNWNSVVNGRDWVEVEAWDHSPVTSIEGGYSRTKFEVHVSPVNDIPSIMRIDSVGGVFEGMEDIDLHLGRGEKGLVIFDPDIEEFDESVMELRLMVMQGAIFIPRAYQGGLQLVEGGEEGEASSVLVVRGGLEALNKGLLRLVYRGRTEWSGEDIIFVHINDLGNVGEGGPLEVSASFEIVIKAKNDPPYLKLLPGAHFVDEDDTLVLDFVLVSDPDSVIIVGLGAGHGWIESTTNLVDDVMSMGVSVEVVDTPGAEISRIELRGLAADLQNVLKTLVYRPMADYAGRDTLLVRVEDGENVASEAKAYLFVQPINDPPVLTLPGAKGEPVANATAGRDEAITGIEIEDIDVSDDSSICLNMRGVEGRNSLTVSITPGIGSMGLYTNEAVGVRVVGAPTAASGEMLTLQASLGTLQAAFLGGHLFYNAPKEFSGLDNAWVNVSDGGNCGSGVVGVATGVLTVNVAQFIPPLAVEIVGLERDSVLYTLEGEALTLPDPLISGGSLNSRGVVEVTVLAVGGNVSLVHTGPAGVEFVDGTGPTGPRLCLRGQPSKLTSALSGLTFHPRPQFSGLWLFNDTSGGTPVRSWWDKGALALVDVIVSSEGGHSHHFSSLLSPSDSLTSFRVKISVGWINDPPTIQVPAVIAAAGGLLTTSISGVRIHDHDVNEGDWGKGYLDVHIYALGGGHIAVSNLTAARNGLQDEGGSWGKVRLRGRPKYLNNVLTTLTFSWGNNSEKMNDEILVTASDNGFTGAGGVGFTNSTIPVHRFVVDTDNSSMLKEEELDCVGIDKKFLPLVVTEEDTDVPVFGLERVLEDTVDNEEVTVELSAREGFLLLGPEAERLAVSTIHGDWTSQAAIVETVGLVDQVLPEIQVIRTSVPWRYEIQQLDVFAPGPLSVGDIFISLDTRYNETDNTTMSVTGASILDPSSSSHELREAVEALPMAGRVRVSRWKKSSLVDHVNLISRHMITFLTRGGDVPLLSIVNWTVEAANPNKDDTWSWNATVTADEVARGCLSNEIQRVYLRANDSLTSGTFRLEAGGQDVTSLGSRWARETAEQDDVFWTSQLGFNSTAAEVATALEKLPNVGDVRVTKTVNGEAQPYAHGSNQTLNSTTNSSLSSLQYWLWEWEVTFVGDGGDLPLLSAVWSLGRTAEGRAVRKRCETCEAFWPEAWPEYAQAAVGSRMEVEEVTPGTSPLSGTFSLTHSGHSFQEPVTTRPISVHATGADIMSALTSLDTIGKVNVARSKPSPQGELSWTVTFLGGGGDFQALEPDGGGIGGSSAAVHVATTANGISPIGGHFSLVVSGDSGEAPQVTAPLPYDVTAKAL